MNKRETRSAILQARKNDSYDTQLAKEKAAEIKRCEGQINDSRKEIIRLKERIASGNDPYQDQLEEWLQTEYETLREWRERLQEANQ